MFEGQNCFQIVRKGWVTGFDLEELTGAPFTNMD